jgi:preprotein translocase subunit YajC
MSAFTAITLFLAENAPQSQPGAGSSIFGNPIVMMVLLVVMFYFLLIRPQQRQRKELEARISALTAGDRVITSSGIHGLVHHVKERTVMIKVADGVMLEFDKTAVAHVQKRDTIEAAEKK